MKQQDFLWKCKTCPAVTKTMMRRNITYAYLKKEYGYFYYYDSKLVQIYKRNEEEGSPEISMTDEAFLDEIERLNRESKEPLGLMAVETRLK